MERLKKIGFENCNVPTGQLFVRKSGKGGQLIFFEDGKICFYEKGNPNLHTYTKEELRAIVDYMENK